MFDNIKIDIKRYLVTENVNNISGAIDLFLFNYPLWVIISYRFGKWVREHFKIPILSIILKIITKLFHSLLGLLAGIQIHFETKIGAGLYIGHTGMS
jgi:serine acetyltransferase